jgi:hypothetical protein
LIFTENPLTLRVHRGPSEGLTASETLDDHLPMYLKEI